MTDILLSWGKWNKVKKSATLLTRTKSICKSLPDRRPTSDTADEQPRVLHESLACTVLIMMVVLALCGACEFGHHHKRVACLPLMACPTVRLSVPTADREKRMGLNDCHFSSSHDIVRMQKPTR